MNEWVFLKLPKYSETYSETMCIGKHYKLSLRYCGPFWITRSYLPLQKVMVHPIYHVTYLKKKLGESDEVVSLENLV